MFLGTFFHKNEEKNSATKSTKKSGGPKKNIEKSRSAKNQPNCRHNRKSSQGDDALRLGRAKGDFDFKDRIPE